VAFSPDGKRVASASEDDSIIVWNAEESRKEAILIGHKTRLTGVAFSPDRKKIVSCDQGGAVIFWDIETRSQQWTYESDRAGYCVAISPDGQRVASSQGVFNSADGARIVAFDGSSPWTHPHMIYAITFSPDGRWLIYPATNGYIVLRDTATWTIAAVVETQPAIAISFSPDGKHFVLGDDDKSVRLWQINPLRELGVIGRHSARVKSVAFSPDGAEVASASDDETIALWDVEDRKLITRIGAHTAPVLSIAFSPDGKRLVSGEYDKSVRLYTRHRTMWGRPWTDCCAGNRQK